MDQITILECRQATSNKIASGDYETTLNRAINIEQGDSIRLKSAFLDTKSATSGKIFVPKTSLTVAGHQYITNYSSNELIRTYEFAAGQNADASNGERFVLSELTQPTGSTTLTAALSATETGSFTASSASGFETNGGVVFIGNEEILYESIVNNTFNTLTRGLNNTTPAAHNSGDPVIGTLNNAVKVTRVVIKNTKSLPTTTVPAGKIFYTYTSIGGQVINAFTAFSSFDGGANGNTSTQPEDINVSAQKDTFKITSIVADNPTPATAFVVALGPYFTSIKENVFEPKLFSATIAIEEGFYDPTGLAKKITDKLSSSTLQGTNLDLNNPIRSPFMSTGVQFPVAENYYFSNAKGKMISMAADPNGDGQHALAGTNQVALEFDADTNKFLFKQLHMPIFDFNGNGTAVVGFFSNNNTTPNYYWATEAGGFLLNNISSDPPNFVEKILGFDSSIFAHYHMTPQTYTDPSQGLTSTYLIPTFDLQVGVNITSQYLGLDAAVVKKPFTTAPTPPTPFTNRAVSTAPFASTSEDIVSIVASTSTINTSQSGYFLIDINTKFKTAFVGSNFFSRSIQGIVSRYYALNSYTSADESAGIAYIHTSPEPMMLTSLRVRILDPSTQLSTDVGDDNTVFVEIIKGSPPVSAKK